MMKDQYKTVIIGAGISGLSAGHELFKRSSDFAVFEKFSTVGGLLDGFTHEGHRFDQAIHLSFATEREVRDIFDMTEIVSHQPEAWCWFNDKWIKHPIHNNLFPLDAKDKVLYIKSFLEKKIVGVDNYEQWLRGQFGDLLVEKFNLPYTEKYWTLPANKLSTNWIGKRIRVADLTEMLFGAMTDDTPNYYYAKEMRYPKFGGYKAFLDPLIAENNIYTNQTAIEINTDSRKIKLSSGHEVHYENLISTIPLPELISIIVDVPAKIKKLASSLHATSIDLISVGFNSSNIQDKLWFYIYDDDILAARCHAPTIKSQENSPPGKSSLQFEIYSSTFKRQAATIAQMKNNTVYALKKMNIVSTDKQIEFLHHKHVPYANVIFDIGMEDRRDQVLEWVFKRNINSVGRFGEWDYLWSNQAFMSGLRAASKIVEKNKDNKK